MKLTSIERDGFAGVSIVNESQVDVALVYSSVSNYGALAEFIIRACNSHADLVHLLEEALGHLKYVQPIEIAEEAIERIQAALAKGE